MLTKCKNFANFSSRESFCSRKFLLLKYTIYIYIYLIYYRKLTRYEINAIATALSVILCCVVFIFALIRPNKIIPLFPEKRVTKKKPTREAGKTFFLYFNPEKNFCLILMLPSLNSRKMFRTCSNKSISRRTTVNK